MIHLMVQRGRDQKPYDFYFHINVFNVKNKCVVLKQSIGNGGLQVN